MVWYKNYSILLCRCIGIVRIISGCICSHSIMRWLYSVVCISTINYYKEIHCIFYCTTYYTHNKRKQRLCSDKFRYYKSSKGCG